MTERIFPGSIRITVRPPEDCAIATGVDASVHVLQEDGSWLELKCVTSLTVSLKADDVCRATMDVAIRELEIVARPESVRRTSDKIEPELPPSNPPSLSE